MTAIQNGQECVVEVLAAKFFVGDQVRAVFQNRELDCVQRFVRREGIRDDGRQGYINSQVSGGVVVQFVVWANRWRRRDDDSGRDRDVRIKVSITQS